MLLVPVRHIGHRSLQLLGACAVTCQTRIVISSPSASHLGKYWFFGLFLI